MVYAGLWLPLVVQKDAWIVFRARQGLVTLEFWQKIWKCKKVRFWEWMKLIGLLCYVWWLQFSGSIWWKDGEKQCKAQFSFECFGPFGKCKSKVKFLECEQWFFCLGQNDLCGCNCWLHTTEKRDGKPCCWVLPSVVMPSLVHWVLGQKIWNMSRCVFWESQGFSCCRMLWLMLISWQENDGFTLLSCGAV